MEDKFKNP